MKTYSAQGRYENVPVAITTPFKYEADIFPQIKNVYFLINQERT